MSIVPLNWIKFHDKLGPKMESGWNHRGPEMRAEYERSWRAWQGIELPVERKPVLVQIAPKIDEGLPAAVAVGYLRYAAGDKECPYFVIPGVGGQVTAFADCLPEPLSAECWPGFCGAMGKITEREFRMEKLREAQEA